MTRYVCGGGVVYGERVYGHTASYLLMPKKLEEIVQKHHPKRIWSPELQYEKLYNVICAQK